MRRRLLDHRGIPASARYTGILENSWKILHYERSRDKSSAIRYSSQKAIAKVCLDRTRTLVYNYVYK